MSKYTTEVRYICEVNADLDESVGFDDIEFVIEKSAPKIFNFTFPIFDENYRLPLEKKILLHYYTREISEETVGLWKLRLNQRLNDIMPKYNQLYKSELYEFNPMYDVDLTTKSTRNTDGTTEGSDSRETEETTEQSGNTNTSQKSEGSDTSNASTTNADNTTANSTNYDLYSDTPQGAITNLDSETYLTNARKKTDASTNVSNGTSTSSTQSTSADSTESTTGTSTESTRNVTDSGKSKTTAKNTEEYIQTVAGKTGGTSYSARLKEFRETFLNIDLEIINELSDLFFGLW
jgi:hypothetical protein